MKENLVIILVKPQLGENIGATARAMMNFGLGELRIVAPKYGWPNPKAVEMAVNATEVLDNAKLYKTLDEAVNDIQFLCAASARKRDMVKPVLTPALAAANITERVGRQVKCGVMFGPERTGLVNDDISLADFILNIPVSDEYPSINLAHSVAIIAYELYITSNHGRGIVYDLGNAKLAKREELLGLFRHLEGELDRVNFYQVPHKRKKMIQNIRNIFTRNNLTDQEVRTLRGIIRSLAE